MAGRLEPANDHRSGVESDLGGSTVQYDRSDILMSPQASMIGVHDSEPLEKQNELVVVTI